MIDEEEVVTDDAWDGREPKASRSWLALITRSQKAGYDDYNDKADRVDKEYSNLERLASRTRDSEFQIFWANIQVLGPSIYSRPPAPVVVPRFKDRKPLNIAASELLERAVVVAFEQEKIDQVMRLGRDDLSIVSRAVFWLRFEKKSDDATERVCIEHVYRRDFIHDPARSWKEVDWVAKRSWMTKAEMRKRFRKTSGDAYKDAAFEVRKDDNDNDDGKLKAGVWELWSKSGNKVVWFTEGVEKLLDEGEPHLTLEDFFPCPCPAYGTTQRNSLIPTPDYFYYQDQINEINDLTNRITALTEAVKVRAFYPAGAGEIGDAIESAIKSVSDNLIMVPIANWGLIGNGTVKDMLVWLPIEMIVKAISELVAMRKQLIEDVYQITGLSDIMRGSTVASETLGAQQLKSQYGSVRIRDRQEELVRVARDLTRISAEIMAENFSEKTLLEMSQVDIPSDKDIAAKVAGIQQQMQAQIQEALSDPKIAQQAQQQPDKAQQVLQQVQQQAQQQVAALEQQPTIEKVVKLLRDQRLRPFVLDIETDSTIAPDEDAQKQRATEYVTAIAGLLGQAQIVKEIPQLAPVFSDVIKFVNSQFRVGREVQATVDEFAEQMKDFASQPKPPDPAQAKAEADAKATQQQAQTDAMKAQVEMQKAQADLQAKAQEAQSKAQSDELERQVKAQEAQDASAARQADIETKVAQARLAMQQMAAKAEADAQRAAFDMRAAAEKHGQEMELGVLNIELLKTKIGQAEAATENAERATEATIAAKKTAPPSGGNGASA